MSETSTDKIKVFISWSGEPSREVAKALRTGIQSVFDMIVPFVSDVDIEAGSRGLQVIEAALQGSGFGVIIVTPDNMGAPWLNFEAGALSKTLGDDENRVVPLLIGFTAISQLTGPLSQFQAVIATASSVRELFHTLGEQVGVERNIVNHRLDGWLSSFTEIVESAINAGSETPPKRASEDLLDELLDLVRGLRRDISTPALGTSSSRSDSEMHRLSIDREQVRGLLRVAGIDEWHMSHLSNGSWVVDVPIDVGAGVLKSITEMGSDLGLTILFGKSGRVIPLQ